MGIGTKIIQIREGYFKLDSNAVLPAYDSSLYDENLDLRNFIESSSNFKLKSEWENGNDSPTDGIELSYSGDTTMGFFAINISERHVGIYGSSPESIRNGLNLFKSLFVPKFQEKAKRNEWYLPLVVIEHNENK